MLYKTLFNLNYLFQIIGSLNLKKRKHYLWAASVT